MTNTSLKQTKAWLIGMGGACMLAVSAAAFAGPFHGKHMGNPLERMLDHIDLTEQQEQQVEAILETLPEKKLHKKGFGMMRAMIELDPDDPGYMEQAAEQADKAAAEISQRILEMAKARQDIYAILTEEQKNELEEMAERKMSRMAKRMADH